MFGRFPASQTQTHCRFAYQYVHGFEKKKMGKRQTFTHERISPSITPFYILGEQSKL